MKKLKVKSFVVVSIFLLTGFLGLLIRSFVGYNESLIAHQQQQLLKIVKSVSNIIETYIENQKNALSYLMETDSLQEWLMQESVENKDDIEMEILQYLLADPYARAEWLLLDSQGEILIRIHNPESELTYQEEAFIFPLYEKKTEPFIPGVYLAKEHQYLLPIVFSVKAEKENYYAVTWIDFNEIDKRVDRDSVKADQKSYLILKDQDGFIILHESKNQIGLHAIEGRQKEYPDVDFTGMNELIYKELEGKEDTFIFDSYWFSDNKPLEKAKKFSAFTPLEVDYGFWIVSINMDYNDFIAPFNREIFVMIGWLSGILLMIGGLAYLYIKSQSEQRELIKETEYLRELNTTLEELNIIKEKNKHTERLQLMGVMAGGITHEFNNILSPIMGYSEMLWKDLPEESLWKDDAFEIYDASCRAKELVLQISALSYKESSKIVYQNFDLNEKMIKWMKSVQLMKPEHVQVVFEHPKESILCYGNATQIYEAVLNLCTNAFHAMKENGVLSIALSVITAEEIPKELLVFEVEEKYICIQVCDTGAGVEDEIRQQMFTPFFTTKKQGEGTGLGLSIVQNIVEAHSGIVWAESELGIGTQIYLCLPFQANKENKGTIELMQQDMHQGGKKRIIVIDYDFNTAKSLAKMLQKYNYTVEIYHEPETVLQALKSRSNNYGVVITSYRLERMDGVILAMKIRQMIPDIRIIMLSGLIKNSILDACQKGIVDAYLMKPVRTEELLELLDT